MSNVFKHKQYEALAELIGESTTLADFYGRLTRYCRSDNEKFDTARFEKAVKKAGALPSERKDALELLYAEATA